MPTPNKGEKQEDFVKRCIPIVLKDGTTKDNDQAVAICENIFREHEKKKDAQSWYKIRSGSALDNPSDPPEITMYDEIGGWGIGADQFQRDLKALGDVKKIKLRINSPGGDAFQGITIHNLLKSHPAEIEAHVDGIAASAASHILMAADKRIMPQNTFLVIHEPSGMTYGPPKMHRQMAEDLDRVKDGQAKDYAAASGQGIKAVKSLMEEDRLMSAKEAEELGYCTECTGAAQMKASFALDKLPEKFRSVVSSVAFYSPTERPMTELVAAEVARVTAIRQIGTDAKADQTVIDAAIQNGLGVDEFKIVLAGLKTAAEKAAAAAAQPTYGEKEINETLEICALGKVSTAEAMKFISAKMPAAAVRIAVQAMIAAAADRNSVSRVDPNNIDETRAGVEPEVLAIAAQFPAVPGTSIKGADPVIVARKLALNKQLAAEERRGKQR